MSDLQLHGLEGPSAVEGIQSAQSGIPFPEEIGLRRKTDVRRYAMQAQHEDHRSV